MDDDVRVYDQHVIECGKFGQDIKAVADDISSLVESGSIPIYRRDGGLMYVSAGKLAPIPNHWQLRFLLPKWIRPRRAAIAPNGVSYSKEEALISKDMAGVLFATLLDRAPLISAVMHAPFVVAGRLVSERGYDPRTEAFLCRNPDVTVPDVLSTSPAEGTEHLERCFSAIPWKAEVYRANYFAWLMSGVLFDPEIMTPLLVVTGNERGVGKTTLLQAARCILHGDTHSPIEHKGKELLSGLSSAFLRGDRFIAIDNVSASKAFSSESLARLLTSGWTKCVRVLGHSKFVSQSGVMIALSANDARLDADLAARSLPVVLYTEQPAQMSPYAISYAREHRRELYAELLGLALQRIPAGGTNTSRLAFRFPVWFEFVYSRIAPRFGPLHVEDPALDSRLQELIDLLYECKLKTFRSADLIEEILLVPGQYPSLSEYALKTHSGKCRFGRFLKRLLRSGPITYQSPAGSCTIRDNEGSTYSFVCEEVD